MRKVIHLKPQGDSCLRTYLGPGGGRQANFQKNEIRTGPQNTGEGERGMRNNVRRRSGTEVKLLQPGGLARRKDCLHEEEAGGLSLKGNCLY